MSHTPLATRLLAMADRAKTVHEQHDLRAAAALASCKRRTWRPVPLGMPDAGMVVLLMSCGAEVGFGIKRGPPGKYGARPIIGLPPDATHWRPMQ